MSALAIGGALLVSSGGTAAADTGGSVPGGGAYGEKVNVVLPTGTRVTSGPLPSVGTPSKGGGPYTKSVASVDQPNLLSTGVLRVSTQSALGPDGFVRNSAEVAGANVLGGAVTADLIQSECTASTDGARGSATLLNAMVLGRPVAVNPGPNTKIELPGIGTLILNEQTGQQTYSNGKTNITVNAVHLKLDNPLVGSGDIILASSTCGLRPPPSGPLSGRAFGEKIKLVLPTGTTVSSGPLPSVTLPAAGGGPITRSLASVDQPHLLTTGVLTVSTQGVVTPAPESRSSAEALGLNLLDDVVAADAVRSECSATSAGSRGSTTLLGASVLGETVEATPGPNTTIELAGIGTLILNEQTGQMTPKNGVTSITVNAIHLKLNSPTKGTGDIIVSSSHCDVKSI